MQQYRIEFSDIADAELQEAFLWWAGRDPDYAGRWVKGLRSAVEGLVNFPRRCPLARENDVYDVEVRRLVYGKGANAYRVLFCIIEPSVDDAEELPVVRILHIYHGAKQTELPE